METAAEVCIYDLEGHMHFLGSGRDDMYLFLMDYFHNAKFQFPVRYNTGWWPREIGPCQHLVEPQCDWIFTPVIDGLGETVCFLYVQIDTRVRTQSNTP